MRRIWSILLALLILAAPVRAAEDEKWVALTFDDGPSGALTERLLDGLAARDVKATFFVCGYRVAEYPAALRRIAAEGHEIGLHSEKHDYMQKMDYEAVLDDLTRCRAEVAECCGTQARLFRPPGGLYSETVLRASSKLDLSLILWSVDPEDWDAKKAASVLPTIRKEVFPGSVILMHDLHESSVDAALTAIDELRAQGYRFCTVSELAEKSGTPLQPGEIYSSFRPVLLVLPRCASGVPSAALTCMVTTCFARAVRSFAPPAFVTSWDRAMWGLLLGYSAARIWCAAVLFAAVTRVLAWAFPRQTCRFPTAFRCLPMVCMRVWCSSMTSRGPLPLMSACRRRMPTMSLHRISRLI